MRFLPPLLLASALALGALAPSPASAAYPSTVDQSVSVCNPQSPATCVKPVLISAGAALVAQSTATAYALSPPTGASVALVQPQGTNNSSGTCAFWRDDGTDPTGTAGLALSAGQTLFYSFSPLSSASFITATGATCAITVFWYK